MVEGRGWCWSIVGRRDDNAANMFHMWRRAHQLLRGGCFETTNVQGHYIPLTWSQLLPPSTAFSRHSFPIEYRVYPIDRRCPQRIQRMLNLISAIPKLSEKHNATHQRLGSTPLPRNPPLASICGQSLRFSNTRRFLRALTGRRRIKV